MPSIMNPMREARQSQGNLNPLSTLTLAQRSNLWPLTARVYPAWRARSLTLLTGQPFPPAREAALLLRLCRPRPGESWLDAGTSTGFYAGVLARAGCRVLAADLSPSMLALARRRETDANITWFLTDLEESGLPGSSFAGVTVGATLNETRRPGRLLRELARLIRPSGQVWLMYVAKTGGPLQRLLSCPHLGGLTFPDPAWVARQLPGCTRTDAVQVGPVVFERYLKEPS